jgi:predicted naringenin-chalcone synthase
LSTDQVSASREVLRRCGNMSSATILFVLEEILKRHSGKARERVCAVAFGPGLTVEMAILDAILAPGAAGVAVAAAVALSPV